MSEDNGVGKGLIVGFLTGSIVGALIGLLYAPKSGKELRVEIKDKSDDYFNDAEEYIEKAKTKEAGVKQPMPPNMLQPGQESKKFNGGKIQLGTNLPSRSTKQSN